MIPDQDREEMFHLCLGSLGVVGHDRPPMVRPELRHGKALHPYDAQGAVGEGHAGERGARTERLETEVAAPRDSAEPQGDVVMLQHRTETVEGDALEARQALLQLLGHASERREKSGGWSGLEGAIQKDGEVVGLAGHEGLGACVEPGHGAPARGAAKEYHTVRSTLRLGQHHSHVEHLRGTEEAVRNHGTLDTLAVHEQLHVLA